MGGYVCLCFLGHLTVPFLSSAESPAISVQKLHIVQIQGSFLVVVSHRLTCFNTWFPVGGTDLEDCGTSRKWSLAGRSVSLGKGLEDIQPNPTSCLLITDRD